MSILNLSDGTVTTVAPKPLPQAAYDLANIPLRCERPRAVGIKQDGRETGREVLASCGRCRLCLQKRAWILSSRIQLEAREYDLAKVSVVTLTYRDDALVLTKGDEPRPDLVPSHVRDWMKRYRMVRKRQGLGPCRYFLCGEYGSKSDRPHYHVVLFGVAACTRAEGTRAHKSGPLKGTANCCATCTQLNDSWGHGFVHCASAQGGSSLANYVSGYVQKRMHRADNFLLQGRHPEFARWSSKPPLGAGVIPRIVDVIERYALGQHFVDVPNVLAAGGKSSLALGRTLQKHLRRALERDEKAPEASWASHAQRNVDAAFQAYLLGTSASQMGEQLADMVDQRRRARGNKRRETL